MFLDRIRVLTFVVLALLAPGSAVVGQWLPAGQTSGPISYNGGNVGIGTASPGYVLHLAGAGNELGLSRTGFNTWQFGVGTVNGINGLHLTDSSASRTIMSLQQGAAGNLVVNGNVGIGTPSPSGPLHVVANQLNAYFSSSIPTGYSRVFFNNNAGRGPTLLSYGSAFGGTSGYGGLPFADLNMLIGYTTTGFVIGTNSAVPLVLTTSDTERLRILGNGNVGIGLSAPGTRLDVAGTAIVYGAARRVARLFDDSPSAAGVGGGMDFVGKYNSAGSYTQFANIKGVKADAIDGLAGNFVVSVNDAAGSVIEVLRVAPGFVGVAGSANFSGTVTGGNIQAKYQDLAEWVPARGDLAPGTVVVLDPDHSNRVIHSSIPYDGSVAGVVSSQPGLILGEGGNGKEMIATTGRVKVKVDATRHAVKIGDALVTSAKPGYAMKSIPLDVGGVAIHRPGTIIGKALEPLRSGVGEILVLLSLQ